MLVWVPEFLFCIIPCPLFLCVIVNFGHLPLDFDKLQVIKNYMLKLRMILVVRDFTKKIWKILGYTTNVVKLKKKMDKILFGYYCTIFLFNIKLCLYKKNYYILIIIDQYMIGYYSPKALYLYYSHECVIQTCLCYFLSECNKRPGQFSISILISHYFFFYLCHPCRTDLTVVRHICVYIYMSWKY